MPRRFADETWALAPPVFGGRIVGSRVGVRGALGPAPGLGIQPEAGTAFGGDIGPTEAAEEMAHANVLTIQWPRAGTADGHAVIPFVQAETATNRIWFFFQPWRDPEDARKSRQVATDALSLAAARAWHSRLARATTLAIYGWGEGPALSRELRPSANQRLYGMGALRIMNVLRLGPVEQAAARSTNNEYYRETGQTIFRDFTGFWVEVSAPGGIDSGGSATWVFRDRNAGDWSWTDQDLLRGRTRYTATGSQSGIPRASPSAHIQQIGGAVGAAAAQYLGIGLNMTAYARDGSVTPVADLPDGNIAAALPLDLDPLDATHEPRKFYFCDCAVVADPPGAAGDPTRNWEELQTRTLHRGAASIAVEPDLGRILDEDGLSLLQRGVVATSGPSAAPGAVSFPRVEDAETGGGLLAAELQVEATIEEERWLGPVFDRAGMEAVPARHVVVCSIHGIAQWSNYGRIGLNGRTYFLDHIRGGSRRRRHSWVVVASRDWPQVAPDANG